MADQSDVLDCTDWAKALRTRQRMLEHAPEMFRLLELLSEVYENKLLPSSFERRVMAVVSLIQDEEHP